MFVDRIPAAVDRIEAAGTGAADGPGCAVPSPARGWGRPGAESMQRAWAFQHSRRSAAAAITRLATDGGADPGVVGVIVENQVHATLAVEGDLAGTVSPARGEAPCPGPAQALATYAGHLGDRCHAIRASSRFQGATRGLTDEFSVAAMADLLGARNSTTEQGLGGGAG